MFTNLRTKVLAIIRGNTEQHGFIACLRCVYLNNKINEVEAELALLDTQAALHVAQRHILDHTEVTPIRPGTQVF